MIQLKMNREIRVLLTSGCFIIILGITSDNDGVFSSRIQIIIGIVFVVLGVIIMASKGKG